MSDETQKDQPLSASVAGGQEEGARTVSKKKDRKRPAIHVRARGRVSAIMDQLGATYRELNPERDCRWVYAPTHKPELSNVLSRRAQGYTEVTLKELPDAEPLMRGLSSDDAVRVGDTILMSIEAELREIFKEELHSDAMEQGERVQRSYYEAQEQLEEQGSGRQHRGAARGSANIEIREKEYEYEQRTSEEEKG